MKYAVILIVLLIQGCAAVNTFPTVARAGDTVSIMVGGSEKARKETISVVLTDANNGVWDLNSMGFVRSVLNLRADGRAKGMHYSSFAESYISWSEGHEPLQTVLVIDIPAGVQPGVATLAIDTNVDDDSSGILRPYSINLEILPGAGATDQFYRKDAFNGRQPVNFDSLEPAPHAKISFGIYDGHIIGAASLIVDYDESTINPDDLNIYVPESNVRGSYVTTGSFGENQRMVYWRNNGQQLFIDIVAPQGIKQAFLMLYIVHPSNIIGSPAFSIADARVYDVDGNEISLTPLLEYYP